MERTLMWTSLFLLHRTQMKNGTIYGVYKCVLNSMKRQYYLNTAVGFLLFFFFKGGLCWCIRTLSKMSEERPTRFSENGPRIPEQEVHVLFLPLLFLYVTNWYCSCSFYIFFYCVQGDRCWQDTVIWWHEERNAEGAVGERGRGADEETCWTHSLWKYQRARWLISPSFV